jgi:hypothetical protein
VGFYSGGGLKGSTLCQQCVAGSSTLLTGSVSLDNCTGAAVPAQGRVELQPSINSWGRRLALWLRVRVLSACLHACKQAVHFQHMLKLNSLCCLFCFSVPSWIWVNGGPPQLLH